MNPNKPEDGILTIKQYETILKESKAENEVLPRTTDIKEWNKIKRLPKLLTDNLHANVRSRKKSLELIEEIRNGKLKKPIVITASVDEANFLIQSRVVNIFFGGRWLVQVEIDGLPMGFCHEGYLMMVDLGFSSFVINKDKTSVDEVLLGINFAVKPNYDCVFKWGGPITVEDVEKRNRDIYILQPQSTGLMLANNTRDCD